MNLFFEFLTSRRILDIESMIQVAASHQRHFKTPGAEPDFRLRPPQVPLHGYLKLRGSGVSLNAIPNRLGFY